MKAGISTTGSWRTADESAPPASAPGASAWMSSLDRIALQTFGQRFPTTHPAETTPGFVRTTNTFRLPLNVESQSAIACHVDPLPDRPELP